MTLLITISGSSFWGYTFNIDFPNVDFKNYEEYIISKTNEELHYFIKCYNLIKLEEELRNVKFHIHTHTTYEELLKAKIHKETIYVCTCQN
jgi:hypothetical protein